MDILKNKEGRLRNGWWIAIFFLLLSSFVFPIVYMSKESSFKISIWHQVVVIAMVSVICEWFRSGNLVQLVGRWNAANVRQIFLAAAIGSCLMIAPAAVLTIFGAIVWQMGEADAGAIASGAAAMMGIAMAEEFLFRGFLFKRFMDGIGRWPAQFLIAAFFLLTHLNNPGMTGTTLVLASVNILTASLLFGFALIKTDNLMAPIAMHFFTNFTQGIVLGFGVSGSHQTSLLKPGILVDQVWLTGGAFGLEASFFGLATLVIVTYWYYTCDGHAAVSNQ
ncbi:MAG: CPBP family intramembrane metalloprotease [Cyclobacteriaceae bacterium]|nr:CPBP family intramembrane metalloprotease [Cyclobacteriaceae bacterium]